MDQGTQSGLQNMADVLQQWFQRGAVDPITAAWWDIVGSLPSILGAVVILLIGLIFSKAVEQGISKGLKRIGFDKFADQIQLTSTLARGGIRQKLSDILGALAYWVIMLAFITAGLNALNLPVAAELVQKVVLFLPKVVEALLILIVGVFAAAFLSSTVREAANNAGILQSNLLGQFVQTAIIIVATVEALKQVGIQFVDQVFLLFFAAVALAAGIAFGLGCKDIAGRWVSDIVEQAKHKR
jgi:small-conductance mechanosensitive channel